MTNLATNLVQTAARYPDRIAVRLDEQVLSYRELDDKSARAASWLLGRGIAPGDRVGLMLPNVPEFVDALLRDPAGRRHRRPDEPAAQGPRGRVLPERLAGVAGARLARDRRRGCRGRPARGNRLCRSSRPTSLPRCLAAASPRPRSRTGAVRHRGHHLHLGHDRSAQGRRTHPQQPAAATSRSPAARCCTCSPTT